LKEEVGGVFKIVNYVIVSLIFVLLFAVSFFYVSWGGGYISSLMAVFFLPFQFLYISLVPFFCFISAVFSIP